MRDLFTGIQAPPISAPAGGVRIEKWPIVAVGTRTVTATDGKITDVTGGIATVVDETYTIQIPCPTSLIDVANVGDWALTLSQGQNCWVFAIDRPPGA